MKWVVHVTPMWVKRNTYRVLMEEPEGKRESGKT
jgi:hypothetical protein